jgi:two-component system chemotaxis response regulator CheY
MRKRILCVDDSKSIRFWLASTLQDAGYEVITASHGREALALIENVDIDMVITDLIQPEMDGIELTRTLRSHQQFKFTPILIATTESQEYWKNEGKKAGASAWLTKPFTSERLNAVVKRFVCSSDHGSK